MTLMLSLVRTQPPCHMSAQLFDWSAPQALSGFDVILACDVLYEDFSVEPLADLVPSLLSKGPHARLLLSDPAARTPQNRERFLQLLGSRRDGLSLNVEEAVTSNFEFKDSPQDGLQTAVVLTTLRRRLGGDMVGVK